MTDVSVCNAALITDTYSLQSWRFKDWRLAKRVNEATYNQIKQDASADAVIYGVPMGVSYSDFQENIRQMSSNTEEHLTEEQATNILWTGLGINATDSYERCLQRTVDAPGIHLTVEHATDNDVTIKIKWEPLGGSNRVDLEWSGGLAHNPALPKHIVTGSHIAVLPRPSQQQQLAVNVVGHGASDYIQLTPLPSHPVEPPGDTEYILRTNDNLQFLRMNNSVQWVSPTLKEGTYNAALSLRLHPDPEGAQYRVGYTVLINNQPISPNAATVDVHFGDHPDVINVGNTVHLNRGPATIVLSIGGVYNADPTFGDFSNPNGGAVAVVRDISIVLRKV